ncbi:MAG: D-alanine--D-alanine ligase [Verrucomicrobiota bacterium]|nr:D-alanine--D-alanine ligase [Verrucomicrobiota bacterium]
MGGSFVSTPTPVIAAFAGGISAEREISLGSGRACALALTYSFSTRLFQIDANALPAELEPGKHVVFSTLHGTFGEDGGMQRLFDTAGVSYAGCDASASALCMDKSATKQRVAARGVGVVPGMVFEAAQKPDAAALVAELGDKIVMKPNGEGSSVGLHVLSGRAEIAAALKKISAGRWLAEKRIFGRELSIGMLGGRALGIVEIRPKSGCYDYTSKYTKGLTEYLCPAPLPDAVAAAARRAAETAFAACGCRDYARIDFMLSEKNELFLLEINTLPGMKETSLLPMSARSAGLDFTTLVRELVKPAVQRFSAAHILA